MGPPLKPKIHIVGAGLAGLAAAVRVIQAGVPLALYEAAPRAGGRCRSYHDPQLGCVIDNGNHLMLSGNHAVMDYLKAIGAADRLAGPRSAAFPFVDAVSGARWSLRPGTGVIPWWLLDPARRVPQTSIWQYLSVARVMRANDRDTMSACVGQSGNLYRAFWEPLTVAVLNTAPGEAAALTDGWDGWAWDDVQQSRRARGRIRQHRNAGRRAAIGGDRRYSVAQDHRRRD